MTTRTRVTAVALALCFGWASIALTQDRDPVARDADRIADMVKNLGSDKFAAREKAKKELEAIGAPALDALRKAVKDENLETAKRAQELVRKIEDRMLTAELLNPKKVRLNVKDKPALEVVDELARLSGYPLQVVGDRAALADKKITLDTGEVSFWEALDRLGAAAGFNEQISVTTNSTRPPIVRPPVIRRIAPKAVLPVAPPMVLPLPAVPALPVPDAKPADEAVALVADEPAADDPAPEKPKEIKIKGVVGKAIAIPGGVIGPVPVGGMPGFGGATGVPTTSAGIQLTPGAHKEVPTSYAGSVRIRALSGKNLPTGFAKGDGIPLIFDAAGEPRLQAFSLIGTPVIHKAIDENGQELTVNMEIKKTEPMPGADGVIVFPGRFGSTVAPRSRQQTVAFKKGEKASKMLKELKGTVTAQAEIPNEIIAKVDDILKASGKSAKGANGGTLTVQTIDKQADGSYHVKLSMENMTANPFGGGNIMINGAVQIIQVGPGGKVMIGGGGREAGGSGFPDLVDAKGNKLQFGGVTSARTNINGGQISQEATVIYRPTGVTGEPTALILFGSRTVTFQVPFAFKDVPLE